MSDHPKCLAHEVILTKFRCHSQTSDMGDKMLSCEIKLHRVMRVVRRVITLLAPVVRTNHVKSGDACDVEWSLTWG